MAKRISNFLLLTMLVILLVSVSGSAKKLLRTWWVTDWMNMTDEDEDLINDITINVYGNENGWSHSVPVPYTYVIPDIGYHFETWDSYQMYGPEEQAAITYRYIVRKEDWNILCTQYGEYDDSTIEVLQYGWYQGTKEFTKSFSWNYY